MKTHFTYMFLLVLLCQVAFTQTKFETLDHNNTSITIGNSGDFISVRADKKYMVPKPEASSSFSTSPIFASSLWIGALDENNSLHLAAMTYGQSGQDFKPGPSSKFDDKKYDRIWKVTRTEIAAHIINPKNPIDAILTWPGNGNTLNNEPSQLAPYEDINKNGVYEPKLGDYPKIKGEVAAYCIYNDNRTHTETGGEPLNIDIHQMFFQERAGSLKGVLDNNNMAWFKIVNRANHTYHDLRIGVWVDFDLGYFGDDYIACDTILDMMYVYNGDDQDEGERGYGIRPPAQGMKFLSHRMSSFFYYNNFTSNKYGNPQKAVDYYNYLNSKRKDSSVIHKNFNVDSPTTTYMYPGDPVTGSGWTETSTGNSPSDRRGVATIGPFNMPPNEAICFDITYVYGRTPTGNNLESINVLRYVTKQTQFIYNNSEWKNFGCNHNEILSAKFKEFSSFSVYPNPSTGFYTIKGLKVDKPSVVTSITGQIVKHIGANETTFDLTDFDAGVYFLKTEVGTMRLVKL